MPYIPPKLRFALNPRPDVVDTGEFFRVAENPGELNFQLAVIVDAYLMRGVNYQAINDVIGVLECLKQEVYRRVAAPYEDRKIETNGEVFACLPTKSST